ncbi:unnamed protein product [Larinioides sclopetarius]|uniref:Uncharacterized protein n=1 Tax=Larinioides sclopetarius TaxID=280406 RepID=A0AAV1ZRK7_9ARAC
MFTCQIGLTPNNIFILIRELISVLFFITIRYLPVCERKPEVKFHNISAEIKCTQR